MTTDKRSIPSHASGIEMPSYKARRGRGLVWVCDVAGSSRLLNRNDTAADTEEFLQRFLYISLLAVNASGGTFVKWTGDGFLAFYELPLDRDLGRVADLVFFSAGLLTLCVNVTQLCSPPKERIRIRHAVTSEKDALIIDLRHSGTMKSKDVLGRSVVAAFRLSGIECKYPGIVTHREVLRAIDDANLVRRVSFKLLPVTDDMRLRFFKGEKFGSRDIYVSSDRQPRKRAQTLKSAQKKARNVLRQIESGPGRSDDGVRHLGFSRNFVEGLLMGPPWCRQVIEKMDKEFFSPGIDALRGFLELSPDRLSNPE
jgi:class 3 adenylate cyclase